MNFTVCFVVPKRLEECGVEVDGFIGWLMG